MRHETPKGIDLGTPEKETFIEIEPLETPVPKDEPSPASKPRPVKAPKREPVPA